MDDVRNVFVNKKKYFGEFKIETTESWFFFSALLSNMGSAGSNSRSASVHY